MADIAEAFGVDDIWTGERIPIQVLYTVNLSDEENRWIRNLRRNLTEKDLNWLSRQQKEYGLQLDLSAYLYAVLNANQKLLKRIWEDKRMLAAETCEIIEKIGWGDKWRQEGLKEGGDARASMDRAPLAVLRKAQDRKWR